MNKKKVLVGYIIDGKHSGIDKYILNFLKTVSSDQVQVDLLTNKFDGTLADDIKPYHARLFEVPNLKDPIGQFKETKKLIEVEQYDVVYFNVSSAIQMIGLMAAHAAKVPLKIMHSHSSGFDIKNPTKRRLKTLVHNIGKLFLHSMADKCLACSNKAGEWLYSMKTVKSDKFKVINNAVDVEKFQYNERLRREKREELNIDNAFVIGHVGSFSYVKNHSFLIDVFDAFAKKHEDSRLVLVGTGDEEAFVKEKVAKLGLEAKVMFLGIRSDVPALMQAFDLFVLPSWFEGLPMVGIEAQISGLPCYFSDKITTEARIREDSEFLPIEKGAKYWADKMADLYNHPANRESNFLETGYQFSLKEQETVLRNIINEP